MTHMIAAIYATRGHKADPQTSDEAMPARFRRNETEAVTSTEQQSVADVEALGRRLAGFE